MSIRVMANIWRYSKHRGSTLLVLLAIGDFADDDGMAFPSIATLQKKARAGERTVQKAIQDLKESGELSVEYGAGPMGCSRYRVLNPHPALSAPVQTPTETPVDGVQDSTTKSVRIAPKPSEENRHKKRTVKKQSAHSRSVRAVLYTQEFEDFWNISSKRGSKLEAFTVWQKIQPVEHAEAHAGMLDHMVAWKQDGVGRRYIPHVRRWLHGRCWETDPGAAQTLQEYFRGEPLFEPEAKCGVG